MTNLKIHEVSVDCRKTCVELTVEFEIDEPHQIGLFGWVDKYTRGICVPDVPALEKYWDQEFPCILDEMEPLSDGSGDSIWKPTTPSPYELGLNKIESFIGSDSIEHVGDNRYRFTQFLADCLIVRACILQLAQSKNQIEVGECDFGDYPAQAGAFRSGSPFDDFVGVLETLNRFWD